MRSNTKITFSIIMPCYNSQDYVSSAVESIKKQTYSDWELIIINDGSIDRTLDIVKEYSEQDDRIKVFSKENGGYVSAVNEGLLHVTGEYFLFLGSDDSLDVGLFENIVHSIDKLEELPDCIGFRAKKKYGEEILIDEYTDFEEATYSKSTTIAQYERDYPAQSEIFFTRDTSKCFKHSLLGDLSYFGRYGVDADGIFSMLFCHRASSFINIPYDGYYWTIRRNSVSSTFSINKSLDRLDNWRLFFDEINEKYEDVISDHEKQYIVYYLRISLSLLRNFKYATKYRKKLKAHVKFALTLSKKYNCGNNIRQGRLACISPILYSSVFCLINVFIKKR